MEIAIIFLGLLALLFTGLPVFLSLGSLAALFLLATGQNLSAMPAVFYSSLDHFVLLAVPLFMLMAQIMTKGGVGDDLFDFVNVWMRQLPGGLAMTTVATCGLFAAICGSSAATAVTVGIAAIGPMLRYNYDKPFVLGLVAAGGTLGILIPPSGPMILYGAVTETSVGKLFIAGIVPGLLLVAVFLGYCWFYASRRPHLAALPPCSWEERWKATRKAALALAIPPIIIGGIYLGVFTPTEAAGIGALLSFLICFVIQRRLGLKEIFPILKDTVKTSAMICMIIGGANYFGQVLTINQIPQQIVQFAVDLELSKWSFLIFINFLLLFLGCFLEVVSCILIVVPIIFPIVQHLGIDPVWFGVIFTINMELALITPPVGMNLFVILGITRSKMAEVLAGIWPYIALMVVTLIVIMLFPGLSLWLTDIVM